jgi:hypothetical protein
LNMRPELAPKKNAAGTRTYLPPASWTLTKKEKESLLGCLKSIKVPTGYSSNISAKVSITEMKLIGMKSHDYHVLMTQLLPVAIRGILRPEVRRTITKLCFFFNAVCSKEIDVGKLSKLQSDLVQTICELEMYFPPSFFDIMVHLTVHLVREIKHLGPMFTHWMFPFERAMGELKGHCRSRSRPEGSIVEGVIAEEVIELYTEYTPGLQPIGLPKPMHEGRLQGYGRKGSKPEVVNERLLERAHLKVLFQTREVEPYVNEHLAELRVQNNRHDWIMRMHYQEFSEWFKHKMSNSENEHLRCLARGPNSRVITHQGFDMNGFTWYTKKQDKKSTVQNSGVMIEAVPAVGGRTRPYYGRIEEIWELEYLAFRTPLFLCEWFDEQGVHVERGVQFTTVDMNRVGYKDDPFILADKQAKQVFYVLDPANSNRHVVLPSKRRIVGVGNVTDESEYDLFDEFPNFSTDIESDPVNKGSKLPYIGGIISSYPIFIYVFTILS